MKGASDVMEHEQAPNQQVTGKWTRFADWLRGRRGTLEAEPSEFEKLRQEIATAQQEWVIAQRHIDEVSEPELIDHAIYYLEAAERKYGYLLREAKKKYANERGVLHEPSM